MDLNELVLQEVSQNTICRIVVSLKMHCNQTVLQVRGNKHEKPVLTMLTRRLDLSII